ncbi:MAG: hypothetical protein QME05_01440 [Candidatus Margulisbacteria bacterium]|nr:hypothetical protein [Candidatus Margulisiibacteriota bacterium]
MSVEKAGLTPGQIYQKAYQRFNQLDAGDGAQDGKINLCVLNKAGETSSVAPFDRDGSNSIHFHEYALGTVNPSALGQSGTAVSENITVIVETLERAKWGEEQIDEFLQIIFQGAGENLTEVLDETAQCISILAKRSLEIFPKVEVANLSLTEHILSPSKADTPQGRLEQLLTILSTACGITVLARQEQMAGQALEQTMAAIFGKTSCAVFLIKPVHGMQNRRLLAALLEGSHSVFNGIAPQEFVDKLNSLDENTCCFLAQAALTGKFESLQDLEDWAQELVGCDMASDDGLIPLLWSDLIKDEKEISAWRNIFSSLSPFQKEVFTSLLQQNAIANIDEARAILLILSPDDLQEELGDLGLSVNNWFELSDLNVREKEAYEKLRLASSAKERTAIIARFNARDISREEGYSAGDGVYATTINWTKVAELLNYKAGISLEAEFAPLLIEAARQLPLSASLDQVKVFFKKVPDQYILSQLLAGEKTKEKLLHWADLYWKEIRPMLGHVFLQTDKLEYGSRLRGQLSRQGMEFGRAVSTADKPSFIAAIDVVDFNTLEARSIPAHFAVLGSNRILVTLCDRAYYQSFIMNPDNPRSFREFIRTNLGEADDPSQAYFVCYFPKIQLSRAGQSYTVSTNYQTTEGNPEILFGKTSSSTASGGPNAEDQKTALSLFMQALEEEDFYLDESGAFFQDHLSDSLLGRIAQEEYLEFEEIFELMQIMDTGRAKVILCNVFGISDEDYACYTEELEMVLRDASAAQEQMSREEFLLRALEICDGRAMLASILAYNVLYETREVLLERYPAAFYIEPGQQDPVGAIYHYYGTFFGAYAVQKCLVERYYSDPNYAEQIDQQVEEIKAKIQINPQSQTIEGVTDLELLLYIQYRLLQEQDAEMREILTLAGIFKEEVFEDADTTQEVFSDVMGMSAGHALHEAVYGVELTRRGATFSLSDNYRDAFVAMLTKKVDAGAEIGLTDTYLIADMLGLSLRVILSALF